MKSRETDRLEMAAKKKKLGRPAVVITKAICEKAEALAGRGLTMEQIAECLGFSAGTLYVKQAEFPEFSESLKRGRAKGVAEISNALFQTAKSGNVTAQIFYLKNRDPENWRDVSHLKHEDRRELERFNSDDLVRIAENVIKQAKAEEKMPAKPSINDEVAGHA